MPASPTAATVARHREKYRDGRRCTVCDRMTPLEALQQSRGITSPTCRRCRNAKQNGPHAQLAKDNIDIDKAPDPRPAIRLRAQLARARRLGIGWSTELFQDEVRQVLEQIDVGDDRVQWEVALNSTMPVWARAYERSDSNPCDLWRLESILSA